ncbi:rho GTPase-activating protein 2-like [Impatiens glandulifera]|uniref:rho GTPase-activating protein 2-like n=1 Tax=Impatiens glandulifera TaxID=253017 RepID=UPI001FB11D8A|nr:rho GTPase-activating protein 2-like [Impatiens glandulifera]
MTGIVMVTKGCGGIGMGIGKGNQNHGSNEEEEQGREQSQQLSLVALLVSALRKSMVSCRIDRNDQVISTVHQMEIGWPTNVQHIAHVTFDRFHGFLGLPVEFEVEVPCKPPSASISVFGVSAESMQCCFDSRGNSVPTILLLLQEKLYTQLGLKAEGIFRINPENSKEEQVRSQLNRGVVPDDIDVHCLAGLIKAWFRELPSGILDGLSPEQVLQCNNEDEFVDLVNQLKPTESALLNWAIDLMADVVQQEEFNKMNARNIAMVFAPNMTQMSDPLTALMHAVQVMNLLKTLILRTLREREDEDRAAKVGNLSPMSIHSYDDRQSEEEMDTSCELRGPISEFEEDNPYYSQDGTGEENEKDEMESLAGEIEECFSQQFDEDSPTSAISDEEDSSIIVLEEEDLKISTSKKMESRDHEDGEIEMESNYHTTFG